MKRHAKGRIHDRISAIPNNWYPAYLVEGDKHNLMIDAGVNHIGPRYLDMIGETLGSPDRLHYLFLTHSHYDHMGAAHYLKRHIPGLQVGAHERLAALLQKPSVLEMMTRLSANHPELLKYNPNGEDLSLRPFTVDAYLKNGDEFDLGGLTCRVYETPGHTRDSLTYYFPEIRVLIPGEAAGVLQGDAGDDVQVEFLSSFQDYVDSIHLMISLEPEMVCLAHGWVLNGSDAMDFLKRSVDETFHYRALIERFLDDAHGDIEAATREMAHAEYDVKGGIYQERISYVTNLAAQVRHIAALRYQGDSRSGKVARS